MPKQNMPKPLVSVITVARNAAPTIAATIESVLAQDYPNFEYVVVDGASTDGIGEILENYRARLAAFVSEPDTGVYDAMNKGIRLSSGSMLLFMNADDRFAARNSLSALVEARLACALEGPVICYADFIKFYPELNLSTLITTNATNFHKSMPLIQQSMLVDRAAFERVGAFNTSLRYAADHEWTVRAQRAGVAFVKAACAPVAIYRFGGLSHKHYLASSLEAARTVRHVYGDIAFARYLARIAWVYTLRRVSGWGTRLVGSRPTAALQSFYLRRFRGQEAVEPTP